MNGPDALAILRKLGVPSIDTADAAAAFGLSTAAASQTLAPRGRLEATHRPVKISRRPRYSGFRVYR